jgi:hypothetical protein
VPRMQVEVVGDRCWRVLAWSGLIAAVFLFASLLQAVATGGATGAVEAGPTQIQLFSAIAAVTDGDEVPAGDPGVLADIGFLAEPNCEMTASQPLHAGQNTWVTERRWTCANRLQSGSSN